MKILRTVWFPGAFGCIGIVLGEDEVTGERKAYIGTAGGFNQEADTDLIAIRGSPFSPVIAEEIHKHLEVPRSGDKQG